LHRYIATCALQLDNDDGKLWKRRMQQHCLVWISLDT